MATDVDAGVCWWTKAAEQNYSLAKAALKERNRKPVKPAKGGKGRRGKSGRAGGGNRGGNSAPKSGGSSGTKVGFGKKT